MIKSERYETQINSWLRLKAEGKGSISVQKVFLHKGQLSRACMSSSSNPKNSLMFSITWQQNFILSSFGFSKTFFKTFLTSSLSNSFISQRFIGSIQRLEMGLLLIGFQTYKNQPSDTPFYNLIQTRKSLKLFSHYLDTHLTIVLFLTYCS